jgi:hypothetical protein
VVGHHAHIAEYVFDFCTVEEPHGTNQAMWHSTLNEALQMISLPDCCMMQRMDFFDGSRRSVDTNEHGKVVERQSS